MQQLAADDSGGQHICYRVHVADQGWSDAMCDGEEAGNPGSGKPITAVNVAVSGTNGTTSRSLVHDPGSTDGEGEFGPWTDAKDGIDNYVGRTKRDAPHMLGFIVSVDRGACSVCQTSYVHNDTWLNLACDKPGDDLAFTYVGTHDNNLWIEAVKLTV